MIKPILIIALTTTLFAKPESCKETSLYYQESKSLYSKLMININCYDLKIDRLKLAEQKVNLSSLKNPLLTPLKFAIYKNDIRLINELLENGAEIDISDVIVAVRNQNVDLVKLLYKYDQNVFQRTMNGIGPLRHAFYKYPYQDNNPEIIDLLKEIDVKLIPNFFPEKILPKISLEIFDKNILDYGATSKYKLSKNTNIEGYRIMDSTNGLYSIFLKDNKCFIFKQGINGKSGTIPYKRISKASCSDIFSTIQRSNFWNSKLGEKHWINGDPMMMEGIRTGEYKTYISWTNNRNKVDTERILNIIKDYLYNGKK